MKYTALVLMAAVAVHAQADWTQIPADQFLVMAPPVAGSVKDKEDLAKVLEYQHKRTPEQCELANRQRQPTYDAFYALSEVIPPSEAQRVRPLMEPTMKFAAKVAAFHKDKFERERPANRDSQIKPCVDLDHPDSKAYPSGHATIGTAAGCVLSQLFPKKAVDWLKYGKQMGELRVISGVHHPTDVLAGQKLGFEICHRLLREADFKGQLNRLK